LGAHSPHQTGSFSYKLYPLETAKRLKIVHEAARKAFEKIKEAALGDASASTRA
jgi:hypothetical protein